ncbi:hypothetical protein M8R20_13950 [Pseudomonas sp. R2.Fl]|nr:hypothetical protein [Pseudomonas sp. R2.Fl]
MKKLLLASMLAATLAGCSQTTNPASDKAAACAASGLNAEECARSKYGIGPTSLPPVVSPTT